MKNYLVIGSPIDHSLSPKIHNYWFNKYKIKAFYDKLEPSVADFENLIKKVREKEIQGINVTVPYKEKIIPFLDNLSAEARESESVNTIYLSGKQVEGHNTDIYGFYTSLKNILNFKEKKTFIIGAGGVTPSIVISLKKLGASEIIVTNRTKERVIKLKEKFNFLEVAEWGETLNADIVINTTSLGLNKNDKINLNYETFTKKTLFYDLIYNPKETDFLKKAKLNDHKIQNGLMMFVYQAAEAFKIWHDIEPDINEELLKYLEND